MANETIQKTTLAKHQPAKLISPAGAERRSPEEIRRERERLMRKVPMKTAAPEAKKKSPVTSAIKGAGLLSKGIRRLRGEKE